MALRGSYKTGPGMGLSPDRLGRPDGGVLVEGAHMYLFCVFLLRGRQNSHAILGTVALASAIVTAQINLMRARTQTGCHSHRTKSLRTLRHGDDQLPMASPAVQPTMGLSTAGPI